MPHDPQDRQFWHQYGAKKEVAFVNFCHKYPKIGLKAEINPEKEHNKYAPDLQIEGVIYDLKTQNTPFFHAQRYYNIEPRWAVSFNRADYERYSRQYPGMGVFFWVEWEVLSMGHIYVPFLSGVYYMSAELMDMMVAHAPLHTYQNRTPDGPNKTESYGLDVRFMDRYYQREVAL